MMLPYLQAIDREQYNKYVDFNMGYLSDLKLNLFTPMPDDYMIKNILAKDEMDPFRMTPADAPRKLHAALGKLIERLYFFNEEEKSKINGLMTYLDLSMKPDLGHIERTLAQLQSIHSELVELETGNDAVIVYAKMLYNRSRIMALQSRGLNDAERELRTDFDKLVSADEIAALLCRMNSIHHALKSIRTSVIPSMKDKEICAMIIDVSEAMITYRRSLIAPEKAGMGEFDLAASEAVLMQKQPTQAAGDNLKTIIDMYSQKNLAFTPADFLLSLNEGVRLSGINLMV
jgi:hypothetical protein